MKIDIEEYLMNYIGDISWYGETNHDNESYDNMTKADNILYLLEGIRENIIDKLFEHNDYRHGNASAEMLHKKAYQVLKSHYPDLCEIMLFNRDKRLLDYITNLQTVEREYSSLLSENAELQQENDRLNNIINELEKTTENRLMAIPDDVLDDETEEIKRTTKIAVYQVILGDLYKLKELKENNNEPICNRNKN